ncbi:MAG: GyrI-like domain-containing protein [Anaerolineae bacterium]|nr:GyrI-like domain-containing protein [Anaerolineae bacterium]
MEPRIIEQSQLTLAGFSFYGNPFQVSGFWTEENEIGRMWKRFGAYCAANQKLLSAIAVQGIAHELHIYHPDTPTTGEFEVFVGFEATRIDGVPLELSIKLLPPARYAVFTLHGRQIASDWSKMIQEWAAKTGHQLANTHSIQRYDDRFKGLDRVDESTLDAYIPLKA